MTGPCPDLTGALAVDEDSAVREAGADLPAGSLSLCMIVRDGEPALRLALESARPYVDELVVVDTGSTDSSRTVAAACGARVIDFRWVDDFSAARNQSLDAARGDWIFWMDADDELPAASGQEFRRLIRAAPDRQVAFTAMVEETFVAPNGRQRVIAHAHVRLFPRDPRIRFQYRIHEQVAPSIRALGWPIRSSAAVVRHAHADRSAAGEYARSQRNLRLARLDLADRPNDPFVWASVGTSALFHPGELPTAIEYLRKAVAGFSAGSGNQLNAYLYLGQALATDGQGAEEERVYREALQQFPHDQMLLRRLADLCERTGRIEEAIGWLESLLNHSRLRPTTVHLRQDLTAIQARLAALAGRRRSS